MAVVVAAGLAVLVVMVVVAACSSGTAAEVVGTASSGMTTGTVQGTGMAPPCIPVWAEAVAEEAEAEEGVVVATFRR